MTSLKPTVRTAEPEELSAVDHREAVGYNPTSCLVFEGLRPGLLQRPEEQPEGRTTALWADLLETLGPGDALTLRLGNGRCELGATADHGLVVARRLVETWRVLIGTVQPESAWSCDHLATTRSASMKGHALAVRPLYRHPPGPTRTIGFTPLVPTEDLVGITLGRGGTPRISSWVGALLRARDVMAEFSIERRRLTPREVAETIARLPRAIAIHDTNDLKVQFEAEAEALACRRTAFALSLRFGSRRGDDSAWARAAGFAFFGEEVELLRETGVSPRACSLRLRANQVPCILPCGAELDRQNGRRSWLIATRMRVAEGPLLGWSESEGERIPIHLAEVARDRHTYVAGATGTGKSTLLARMIAADMAAGRGLALIDPHGTLCDDVLAAVPRARRKEVIELDFSSLDAVPGLNVLELAEGERRYLERNLVVGEMFSIIGQLYDLATVGGPMFEMYFRAGLLLLTECDLPGLSLTELPLVYSQPKIRAALLARCRDANVIELWKHTIEKAGGESRLENIAPYIVSKLSPFLQSPVIRGVTGQLRSSLDLWDPLESTCRHASLSIL